MIEVDATTSTNLRSWLRRRVRRNLTDPDFPVVMIAMCVSLLAAAVSAVLWLWIEPFTMAVVSAVVQPGIYVVALIVILKRRADRKRLRPQAR